MTRYQAETRKQERRKKKALVKRLILAASALNPIKSPQIESTQGIFIDGVSGCPNQLKRKRINSRPDSFMVDPEAPEPFLHKHFGEPTPSVWLVRYSHTWSNKAVSFAYAQPCAGQGWAVLVS